MHKILNPTASAMLGLALVALSACNKSESPQPPANAATEESPTPAEVKPAPTDPADPAGKTKPDAKPAPKPEAAKVDPNVIPLFDGKKLGKWKPVQFGGEGEVFVTDDGYLQFDFGALMSGVVWGGETPARHFQLRNLL